MELEDLKKIESYLKENNFIVKKNSFLGGLISAIVILTAFFGITWTQLRGVANQAGVDEINDNVEISGNLVDLITKLEEDARVKVINLDKDKVPIGTIISSLLNYKDFMELNKFKIDKKTISKNIWVPCDGRIVKNSKYSIKKDTVPDLRGLFLRNVNKYGLEGVKEIDSIWKNPENKDAGQRQKEEVGKHSHFEKWINVKALANSPAYGIHPNIRQVTEEMKETYHFFNEGQETRPKNMTVYYYIKIN